MTDRIGVSGRWCWTVLALAMFCLESQASNHATGLMEVYGLALEYDPTYHAAMKERDAGLGERAIGRAALLPKLSLQYQSGRNESEVTQPGFFGSTTTDRSYRSYSSSLTLEQPIIDYEAISRYYRGVAQAHHADARFRSRSQELAVRVTQAYTEALYANDQIELAQAQKRAFTEQMKLNGRRLQVGEGTRTDMLETQARYDLAQAQEIEAQDNADAAIRDLIAMVGQPLSAQDLAPLAEKFEVLPLELNRFEAWRDIALLNNPELASLRYALDAADEQIEQARAGHLPKVSLYATAGRQKSSSESTYDQRYVTNSVGIQVSVPIFAGGGVSAAVGQAVDNSGRLRYENDAKLNEVMNDLRKQFNLYNSSFAKMRAFQLAVNSAQELTVAMKKSVAGGERVNSDILDAEQRYYDALRNLAQARYAYLTSWLKVRFLAGKLSDVDISILAQCFDVTRQRNGERRHAQHPKFD
ncbi:outer membrane protein, protease secretion system [Pseudomonas brenneri]|uniref:Outer membrane protein, protease secretion system n=2 Tax=Pseudomonas brenneri TaxID=129817 RepID=A0ABY0W8J2_9PSED|nr:outer membrane protein, protease secretion system [Pseudomonas brenneri]